MIDLAWALFYQYRERAARWHKFKVLASFDPWGLLVYNLQESWVALN